MIIRDVEDRDAEKVREYAEEFMEYYPVKVEYELYSLLKVLENLSEKGIFLVIEEDGEVVGGVGGLIGPHYFAPNNTMAVETFLWIDKTRRGSTLGSTLVTAFEEKAKELGCDYVNMTSTVHTPEFKDYLLKNDYTEAETNLLKEI